MKKVLVMAVAFTLMASVAHAQVGYGGETVRRARSERSRSVATVTGGEVLGASTVSPEIQAQIDLLKAQIAVLIQQMIDLLKQQLAAAIKAGNY